MRIYESDFWRFHVKINQNFLLLSPLSRYGSPAHPECLIYLEAARASATPHQRFPGSLDLSWEDWGDTWILGDPVESQRNQMCPHASQGGLGELRSMVMSSLKMGMKIATGSSRAQLKTWSSFIAWIGVSPFGDESIVTSHVKNSSSFTLMCFVLPCESLDNCL